MEERELPVGWDVAPIAEVAIKVGSGATPRGGQSAYQSTGIPLIRSMNVVFFGFKQEGLAFINEEQALLLSNAEVRRGDVLLNITGASIGRVTTAPSWSEGARVNQHVCIIRPADCMNQRFLSAYLSSPAIQSLILDENYGVTRQALTKQQVLELVIPVPPINEQRRIAAKLDTTIGAVEACRQRLDGVAAILKRFRQAVLAAATSGELTREWREERGMADQEWPIIKTKEAGKVQLGRQRSPKYHSGPTMRPYLRVQNIFEDRIDLSDVMEMDFSGADLDKYRLHPGDILLNEGQSPQYLGRPALYRGEMSEVCFTNSLIRFQAAESVLPEFALLVFRHCMHSGRYVSEGTITTNIAHLSAGRFGEVEFPKPTLQEQAEIVSRTKELFSISDQFEAKLTSARKAVDRLTPALLAKAFRGELVPQDPNDEPACMLLERILAAREAEAATGKPSRRGRPKAAANPAQDHLPAAPVQTDLLAQLLQECGALSERALLAASELEPGRFQAQLELEVGSGNIRAELEGDKQVLIVAREE